uniref:CCHC-type domain-containing protein n=1 Tax=Manihot esculenta TaxID=3983 RepID=A0A2C9VED6_MANES
MMLLSSLRLHILGNLCPSVGESEVEGSVDVVDGFGGYGGYSYSRSSGYPQSFSPENRGILGPSPNSSNNTQSALLDGNSTTCFNCGSHGHVSHVCPSLKINNTNSGVIIHLLTWPTLRLLLFNSNLGLWTAAPHII